MIKLFECGCCGCYHRVENEPDYDLPFNLDDTDCRNDDNRFAGKEDASERLGIPESEIEEVWLDEQEDEYETDN